MSLHEYVRKRDFTRTEEPHGTKRAAKKQRARQFVIQKHDASRLHYDFRLELGGTLKSWAVPKGVPFAKGEKRLAMQVEDHPLDYASFEGVIPKGQYGGGTVMVWDTGTYEPLGARPQKDLDAGKLHFLLRGGKLKGEWTLVRMARGAGNEWLLIKSGEEMRAISRKKDDESALTGRSMAQIARGSTPDRRLRRAEMRAKPEFVAPMKATLLAEPPGQDGWMYELKFDGYRAQALKAGKKVQLLSSNAKDFSKRYAEIAEAVAELPVDTVILDGEIVALDEEGRSSFQMLQALETGKDRPALAFYVFDLLHHDGANLLDTPLHERRRRLEAILRHVEEPLRYSAEIGGDPRRILDEVRRRGLEGIIGKECDSRYEPGRRSRSWIKLKCVAEQEMVIGGYTPPEGTRSHFGALLIGYYRGGALKFAGRVGTGFDEALLKQLHRKMRTLHRDTCPFANLPERSQGRWRQNITPREMKLCHWIEPELVCQVRFGEWTRDGKLRQPVFLGLREDKDPRTVVRETAQ